MNSRLPFAQLGEPNLQVAGLRLWVQGRELPDATEFHDANWLLVTADCIADGARVWVQGPILMTSDIAAFARGCEGLRNGTSESAELRPLEPELAVRLRKADDLGHIEAEISITPNHLRQKHRMVFAIDQSHLPLIISMCGRIIEEYPVLEFKDKSI